MKSIYKMMSCMCGISMLLFILITQLSAQSVPNTLDKMTDKGVGYLEYLPADYATSTEKYPVLIFLHGSGESGNGTTDLPKLTAHSTPYWISSGQTTMTYTDTVTGKTFSFVVIMPQTNNGWSTDKVDGIVNYVYKNYRVDSCRLYLTGISMGGRGTWSYIMSNYNSKNKFAAVVISDGGCGGCNGCTIAERGIPIWALHGAKDVVVPLTEEQPMIDGINACTTPVASPKAKYTIYPNDGHGVWAKTYFPTNKYNKPNVFEWMLTYTLNGCNTVTSTDNTTSSNALSASPNPFTDNVSITNTAAQTITSLTVFDQIGKLVLEQKGLNTTSEHIDLDLSSAKLPHGVYFLRIELKNASAQMIKLVK